jgi:hypothetical protein
MHAGARRVIQLVGRHVVAKHVATVVGKPEFARLWMPGETDRVAHSAREYLKVAAVRLHPHDVGVSVAVRLANVARRTDRYVQVAIGPNAMYFQP